MVLEIKGVDLIEKKLIDRVIEEKVKTAASVYQNLVDRGTDPEFAALIADFEVGIVPEFQNSSRNRELKEKLHG